MIKFTSTALIMLFLVSCYSFKKPSVEEKLSNTQIKWRAIVFAPQGKKSTDDFLPDFKKLVEDAFVPLGINAIIFDMHWKNFHFTCRPELANLKLPIGRQFTKKDAEQMAEICRKNNIHVFVGMNFLTHQSHGQLLKAFPKYNWPGTKSLWDPLNPEVNKIAFEMADELIDAFKPEGFHVGMDEAWDFKLNTHPGAKKYTPSKLFAKCVNDYYKHIVLKRKLDMLIWSDMLQGLHGKNTGGAIDLIPKDIIICYWDYSNRKSYPWLKKFTDKGFRTLACPWKNSKATESLVNTALKIDSPKMLGVLYTTWCGKISSDLRPALLNKGDQKKLNSTAKGVAASINRTIKKLTENQK